MIRNPPAVRRLGVAQLASEPNGCEIGDQAHTIGPGPVTRDRPTMTSPDAPLDATIHLAFAFDIGYEVDLDRARALVPTESGLIARRRRTPESIQYRPAPLRLTLDVTGMALPGGLGMTRPPRAELTIFDFAAISLMVQFSVRGTTDELRELAGHLADTGPLVAAARLVVSPWVERLQPVVDGFEVSDLSEEYVIFQLGDVSAGWVEAHTDWIAGLIRLEADPLSVGEIHEATRLRLSYTPDDLVMLDWAAGFVADRDCAETLQVIEFANVQLLEFRHIDDRLDDRLEAAYRLIHTEHNRKRRPAAWRVGGPNTPPFGASVNSKSRPRACSSGPTTTSN